MHEYQGLYLNRQLRLLMAYFNVNGTPVSKVDLFPMFKKNINRDYPESDGWKVYNRFNWVSYLHDFVLEREVANGIERVVVEINTDKKVTNDQISQLGQVALRLANHQTKVVKKILVVSEEADTQGVPPDIEVMYLGQFLQRTSVRGSRSSATPNSDILVA